MHAWRMNRPCLVKPTLLRLFARGAASYTGGVTLHRARLARSSEQRYPATVLTRRQLLPQTDAALPVAR